MDIKDFQKADRLLTEIKNLKDVKHLNPTSFIIKDREVRFSQEILEDFKIAIQKEIDKLENEFEEL